jgi:diguanylate cyclase (GGDEF)-like protein
LILFVIGTTATAACWGLVGSVLMPSHDYAGQMIIVIIMAGVAAGATQSIHVNLLIISLYLSLMTIPLCIWLLLQDTPGYFTIFLSMTMYYIFSMISAYRSNAIINRVLKLHFINLTLMENITESNMELQERNTLLFRQEYDTTLINKLNKTLQLCETLEEAYPAIKDAAEQLFNNFNGALTVTETSDTQRVVVQWGNVHLLPALFPTHDCWALRSGALYKVKTNKPELLCHHYHYGSPPEGKCRCIPLISPNGIFGLLFLNIPDNIAITKHLKQTMTIFAETVKVGLISIQFQMELRQQATHDPLTGLYNRRYLNDLLERELKHIERDSGTLCIALFDIDSFKKFNDTYGHEAGDEALKMASKILISRIRKVDILCRYGGDEFVLVLVNTDIEKTVSLLDAFRIDISQQRIPLKGSFLDPCTVSIGVAEASKHGMTVDKLIEAADNAMYIAKKSGGNKVVAAE